MPENVMKVEERSWSDAPHDKSFYEQAHVMIRAEIPHWGLEGEALTQGRANGQGKSFTVYTTGEADAQRQELRDTLDALREQLRKEFVDALAAVSTKLFTDQVKEQLVDAVLARLGEAPAGPG